MGVRWRPGRGAAVLSDEDRHAETYGRRLIASAIFASTIAVCVTVLLVTVLVLYFG